MIYLFFFLSTLAASALESVTYFGFILKHLHFSAYWIYFLGVLAALTPRPVPRLLSQALSILAYPITIAYLCFIYLETTHYPNYIYTQFHVNPLAFQFFVCLVWLHVFIQRHLPLTKALILAVLIYIGSDGAGRTFALIRNELTAILHEPFLTYDQKMSREYWGFYSAMKQVRLLTPDNATLLIPPQGNPWEVEGNGAMVRYFIYPRKLANLLPDFTVPPQIPGPTYILIAKGSWPSVTNPAGYGWPKVVVDSRQIWHIDLATGKNYSYNRPYDPTTDQWNWGLIEVPHD